MSCDDYHVAAYWTEQQRRVVVLTDLFCFCFITLTLLAVVLAPFLFL